MFRKFQILLLTLLFHYSTVDRYEETANWDFVESLLKHILLENFTREGPVFISLSNYPEDDFPRHQFGEDFPRPFMWLEFTVLKLISENSIFPLIILHPEKDEISFNMPIVRSNGYIIFINSQIKEYEDLFYENIFQLQSKLSWNSRSKFLVVAYGVPGQSSEIFVQTLLDLLKDNANVVNVLLLIIGVNTEQTQALDTDENQSTYKSYI